MPVNTKYPNIPSDFSDLVRDKRKELKLSLTDLSNKTGLTRTVINQIEHGTRNCSYPRAVLLREALEIDIELPEPDLSKREPITRNRIRRVVANEPFYIVIDGELIQVRSYINMGPVKDAQTIS